MDEERCQGGEDSMQVFDLRDMHHLIHDYVVVIYTV